MANSTGGSQGPLDPKVADALLERLSTDDGFRERFSRDPRSALAEVGGATTVTTSSDTEEHAPAMGCLSVSQLASKEEIAKARDELRSHLTSNLSQTNPHCFEAGQVSDSLKGLDS